MMRPLHDRVLVELDESIPTNIPGFIIPIVTDKFRAKDGAVESYNRGTVVAVGPGKKDPKTLKPANLRFDAGDSIRPLQAGDVVRFSELAYPEHKENGKRYALITEGDVVGVEMEAV